MWSLRQVAPPSSVMKLRGSAWLGSIASDQAFIGLASHHKSMVFSPPMSTPGPTSTVYHQ